MNRMRCTTSRLPFSAGEEQADSRLEAPQEPLLQLRADATGELSAQSPSSLKYPLNLPSISLADDARQVRDSDEGENAHEAREGPPRLEGRRARSAAAPAREQSASRGGN